MSSMPRLSRLAALLACVAALTACAKKDTTPGAVPLGNFALGYDIVVAKNMQTVGPTREATPEEWETALETEISALFSPYQGDKLYHVAASVDAYALALPGIPVVVSPKSVLVISVNIWDDAAGAKLNAEPKQITVFESASEKSVIGSGLTQTKEQQIQNLSVNAARQIQKWMTDNPDWFGIDPGAAVAPVVIPPATPVVEAVPPADAGTISATPLPEPFPATLP